MLEADTHPDLHRSNVLERPKVLFHRSELPGFSIIERAPGHTCKFLSVDAVLQAMSSSHGAFKSLS